jgi:hypothetical protein
MPRPLNWYFLSNMLADVSTASSVRFCVPEDGYLRKVETTLGAAITVANSTVTVSHNNTALSPTITVAFTSSAEGDHDEAEFFEPVSAGDWIEVATDGGSTTTAQLGITLTFSG